MAMFGLRWLAQRQALPNDAIKNNSYWDHNSGLLLNELNTFKEPWPIKLQPRCS